MISSFAAGSAEVMCTELRLSVCTMWLDTVKPGWRSVVNLPGTRV